MGSLPEWEVYQNGKSTRMGSPPEWEVYQNGKSTRMGSPKIEPSPVAVLDLRVALDLS